jgi:hypothetical protein
VPCQFTLFFFLFQLSAAAVMEPVPSAVLLEHAEVRRQPRSRGGGRPALFLKATNPPVLYLKEKGRPAVPVVERSIPAAIPDSDRLTHAIKKR